MSLLLFLTIFIVLNNGILPEIASLIKQMNLESKYAIFGLNEFSNIPISEFKKTHLMNLNPTKMLNDLKNIPKYITKHNSINDIPSSFDWRTLGAVTSVKNQESCGTCWAFSTTGNIEGQWYLYHNKSNLVSLSEEFLVDCDKFDCGMFGGYPYDAYQYIISEGGIPSEQAYPYCCGTKDTCYPCMAQGYNKTMCGNHDDLYCNKTWNNIHCPNNDWIPAANINGWMPISQNEDQIAISLYELGPLSVLMNAESLSHYKSGIYDPKFCDPTSLDHAVLIVGYGIDSSLDNQQYWIVKNSWGQNWGENGYFRILRGQGTCGINTAVTTSCVDKCNN